jgi:hypothetical protein
MTLKRLFYYFNDTINLHYANHAKTLKVVKRWGSLRNATGDNDELVILAGVFDSVGKVVLRWVLD